jgi:tetratricopeptide (TPR) repeat protein
MRIILIPILFTILSCSVNKTDFEKYNELDRKAMVQFKDKEFEKALLNFEKAINLKPTQDVSIYFYATASALNAKKNDKAKELLIASILNTNTSKDYFLNFDEFDKFRKEKLFSEIEKNYEEHISEFYDKLEYPEIYREVDSLMAIDQEYRTNGSEWNEISRIDSLNINRLIEITKEYGWQKKGWLVLWHQRGKYGQDNYVWNFFKPYIDEQIKNDKITKDFWVIFEEERSIVIKKEQIYGMYWSQYDEYPIIDIENVDKRRAKYDVAPLWYMEKVYGIELPAEYKKL